MSSDELAKMTNIPPHYLSKIMKILVDDLLVESTKGHGGGFKITRPLKEIRFIDILSACSYGHEPDKCVLGDLRCNAKKPCVLHSTWSDLNNDFKRWSKKQTLWHVKQEGKRLGKLITREVVPT